MRRKREGGLTLVAGRPIKHSVNFLLNIVSIEAKNFFSFSFFFFFKKKKRKKERNGGGIPHQDIAITVIAMELVSCAIEAQNNLARLSMARVGLSLSAAHCRHRTRGKMS